MEIIDELEMKFATISVSFFHFAHAFINWNLEIGNELSPLHVRINVIFLQSQWDELMMGSQTKNCTWKAKVHTIAK